MVRKVEVFVYEGGFLVIYTGPVVIYSDVYVVHTMYCFLHLVQDMR